jgi:hypothetical protein
MSLEQAIQNLADAINNHSAAPTAVPVEPQAEAPKPKAEPKPKKAPRAEVTPQESIVTVDQVRAVMIELKDKSKAMELLKKYGGGKLPEIAINKLADLFADAHAALLAEEAAEDDADD